MLTVRTYIDKSSVHGFGLFAAEFIPKDKLIWELDVVLDLIIKQDKYEKLPLLAKEYFDWFGYYSESRGGWILCFDNARFVNHSKSPNTYGVGNTIALQDIQIGEEITENYYIFNEKEPFNIYK
jgi:uncharacterized protein